MANTVNNLWLPLIDFENVYKAFKAASKGRRYRGEVLDIKVNLEDNIISIIEDLKNDTYTPLPLRQFYITDPKKRLISAPAFRDRIVHHALVQVIEPVFEKRFINENFACRLGRGTHAAMHHIHQCSMLAKRQWGTYYVLKCDVTKFFPSVDHDVLKRIVRRAIRDRGILHLLDIIIDSYASVIKEGCGIPIGALTSQLLANAYLDPLDHYLKETCGVKYYGRYMDDFVILHRDKAFLMELWGKIDTYLQESLKVFLNPKTTIFPGRHGIDFCGYRIWPSHIKPRKSTVKRARKRMRKMTKIYKSNPKILEHAKNSLQSFFGYIKHCSGYETTRSILREAIFKGKKPALPDKEAAGSQK